MYCCIRLGGLVQYLPSAQWVLEADGCSNCICLN